MPEKTASADELRTRSLADEEYREYVIAGVSVYRINNPVSLTERPGGTTHRVLDGAGIVHCIPFGGSAPTVLRWKARDASKPVSF